MARRKSLYEIIYSQIEKEVQKMSDGTQLPSIEKLCEDYGASKTVLREVITALEKD
ncbi:MAG: Transcriptional regulator, partial [Mesotoga prima]